MRAFVLVLVLASAPTWAATDLGLLASATQAYATCMATESSKTSVATSITATERVREAVDACAALRQRVADALDPRDRDQYFAQIDRDILDVARQLASEAVAGASQ